MQMTCNEDMNEEGSKKIEKDKELMRSKEREKATNTNKFFSQKEPENVGAVTEN